MADWGKEDFYEMVQDFLADHADEYQGHGFTIDEIINRCGEWVAIAHDDDATYEIEDDGKGNIYIQYAGTR